MGNKQKSCGHWKHAGLHLPELPTKALTLKERESLAFNALKIDFNETYGGILV